MKNIAKKVEAIRKELNESIPEPQNPKEKKKMATKKKGKKSNKKSVKKKGAKRKKGAKKKSRKTSVDGGVTLAALADKAGISGQKARQLLRKAGIEREEGGRWSWKEGSKALKAARKAVGL